MTDVQMTYAWRAGFRAAGIAPASAATELERIRAERGKLRPSSIVEAARPATAPLHPAFEWDDGAAAEAYRLMQARNLVRSIIIVREDTPPDPVYTHLGPDAANGNGDADREGRYERTEDVVKRPDLYEIAVRELMSKLNAAEQAVRDLERIARQSPEPDRLAKIGMVVAGFEAVKEALAVLRG